MYRNGTGADDRDVWLVVMRTLVLSTLQKREVVQLRRLYLGKLAILLQQRRCCVKALGEAQPCFLNAHHTSERYLQVLPPHIPSLTWCY